MTDKIAVCAIGRMENRYVREWVSHYFMLGFDHIFIYDNNFGNEEHFEDVLEEEIRQGFVQVIDVRDCVNMQKRAYEHCYEHYGYQYKWIAFFDFDEFLTLEGFAGIHDYLENMEEADAVLINWRIFTDNGLIYYDPRPLSIRFTEPMPDDRCVTYNFPENYHIKAIVKGGLSGVRFSETVHVPSEPVMKCVDSYGRPAHQKPIHVPYEGLEILPLDSGVRLNHYTTKTIEEWITCKVRRGFPCSPKLVRQWRERHLEQFFAINVRTEEKERIAKELTGWKG